MTEFRFNEKLREIILDRPKIRGVLDEKGWSAYRLAREMNIADKTVQTWLKETANPRTQSLAAIAKVLGVTVGYITDFPEKTAHEQAAALHVIEEDMGTKARKLYEKICDWVKALHLEDQKNLYRIVVRLKLPEPTASKQVSEDLRELGLDHP